MKPGGAGKNREKTHLLIGLDSTTLISAGRSLHMTWPTISYSSIPLGALSQHHFPNLAPACELDTLHCRISPWCPFSPAVFRRGEKGSSNNNIGRRLRVSSPTMYFTKSSYDCLHTLMRIGYTQKQLGIWNHAHHGMPPTTPCFWKHLNGTYQTTHATGDVCSMLCRG